MRNILFITCMIGSLISCGTSNQQESTDNHQIDSNLKAETSNVRELSVKEYQEKVYASWISQIIGNTYGLSYEFKFIDEPGPDKFPYGYGFTLETIKEVNGAFSDDDTDIEYMYLMQMEKHGTTPSYKNLADAWKYHVRDKVWCANRVALGLMHQGMYPPFTGYKENNSQYCQIDPQLINEIWAITAPAMIDYATDKSEWAGRIMADSMGIEPTIHYAAMYSAAFFESDVNKLIDIGTAALPEGSYYASVVENTKEIYNKYPNNWKKARQLIKQAYCIKAHYNRYCWEPIDACLNGACGVLAMLYGQGDFQETLDISCALGFDADNQAATVCGILGIANGLKSIPESLLNPLPELGWEKPFNDSYKNITRHDMPDASLTDLANRIAKQGELIILENGGKIIEKDNKQFYQINTEAEFMAPFELNSAPAIFLEPTKNISFEIYTGVGATLEIIDGNLPKGITLTTNGFSGKTEQKGSFKVRVKATYKEKSLEQDYEIHVIENLAYSASEILFNSKKSKSQDIEIIRDGISKMGESFSSEGEDELEKNDFYGYVWESPQTVNTIVYNCGVPDEFGGWFTSIQVEYKGAKGGWKKVQNLKMPVIDLENNPYLKPTFADYVFTFDPVEVTAIRIKGNAGGTEKDANNAHKGKRYWTAIAELSVYNTVELLD